MIVTKSPDRRLFYGSDELRHPPAGNFYVRLNAAVGGWASLCSPLGGVFCVQKNGRPVDPVVYFKIFLVGYLEGIVFDTDLAERIGDSISIREFVGYGPCEQTPDHSSLSRVRTLFAKSGALEDVMSAVVALCVRAGLVSGQEVAADSTLIPANASLSSLRCVKTGISVQDHLNRLRAEGQRVSVRNEEFRSRSDPDARIAKKGTSPRGMYHKLTHVTDAKSQVILAASVSTADTGDSDASDAPLSQAKQRLQESGLKLGTVVLDAGYDDSKLHARVEALGASPLTNYTIVPSSKPEGFAKSDFTYDADRDVYVCPNGKTLVLSSRCVDRHDYRSLISDCRDCPFKTSCLAGRQKRRLIPRTPDEGARERNIARCHTDEGRAALKRRKTVVEPPFGHLKRYGGLRTTSCRTTKRVQIKATMAAIGWNLMKLVRKAGPGGLLRSITNLLEALSGSSGGAGRRPARA